MQKMVGQMYPLRKNVNVRRLQTRAIAVTLHVYLQGQELSKFIQMDWLYDLSNEIVSYGTYNVQTLNDIIQTTEKRIREPQILIETLR